MSEKFIHHNVSNLKHRASQKMLRTKNTTVRILNENIIKKLILWNPFIKKQFILCRSACLGHDILKLKYPNQKRIFLICQQKVRLDLFMEQIYNNKPPFPLVKSTSVEKHMTRKDIYGLVQQQEQLPWLTTKEIDYLIMDSFSELTDKKFTNKKEGWSFFCHNSDIKLSEEFEQEFDSRGLLSIDKIGEVYKEFFSWFENKYPGKKVIFIHYPTTLDDRVLYKERAVEILRAMKDIGKNKNYIYNIYIDDSKVSFHENDNFPYHYSKKTNHAFLEMWKELENK